ncbi:methyltransferase domain-containing protein [uncultured Tistrella sp.]|uniref:methyltransferase domain-containing protein n=1 Tax=Tistrella mobilis TaxID=171437 RepID=UPI000C0B8668|nr:methyltransferase domain-containing protein [uncultured Tistrella sp.]MAM74007.1 SAM-dependent methyltransferase [Tistrella sp.]
MTDPIRLFDRALLRRRRDRAARAGGDHGFLLREVAERLAERLDDVLRDFPRALMIGSRDGASRDIFQGRRGIETLIGLDLSPAMAAADAGPVVVADEELLPIADGSMDLVLGLFSLHWTNDLPGALIQIERALKPDGLFLGAIAGGSSLKELREALTAAEIEIDGGLSPRVSPFAELRDAAGLMQRAGFQLPVVDVDTITLTYAHPLKLLAELRMIGATNVLHDRRRAPLKRATLMRAMEIYVERFARPDGRVPATLDLIHLAGWKKATGQPQPRRRGTADTAMSDMLARLRAEVPGGEGDAG